MEEYILYVILIFIPIGGAMAYLLHRDGFPRKYINVIVVVSLLIILSFPISMERLGGLASLMIYVLLVAIISWYILKGKDGLPLFNIRLPAVEQFVNHLINYKSSIATTNETPDNDELCMINSTGEILENQEISEEKMDLGINPEEGKDEEQIMVADEIREVIGSDERIAEIQIMTNVETASGVDWAPETIPAKQEIEEHMPGPEEIASSGDTTLQKDVDTQVEPLIREMVEPTLVDEDIDEMEEIDQLEGIGDADNVNEIKEVDEIDGVDKVNEVEEVEEVAELEETNWEDEVEEGEESEESVTSLKQGLVDISVTDREEAKPDPQVQIMELIDKGFAYRNINREETARCFEEVWQITSEYELKYVLTVELVEIYKECGWYSKAGAILDSFIALPGHKSDIINEINRQFDYISLLAAELERLGISDLPISRVPRWVRLKVDGEMNPQEFR